MSNTITAQGTPTGVMLRPHDWTPPALSVDEQTGDPIIEDPDSTQITANFFDPHGNHVETISGTVTFVNEQTASFLTGMIVEGYPCSVTFEPGA